MNQRMNGGDAREALYIEGMRERERVRKRA